MRSPHTPTTEARDDLSEYLAGLAEADGNPLIAEALRKCRLRSNLIGAAFGRLQRVGNTSKKYQDQRGALHHEIYKRRFSGLSAFVAAPRIEKHVRDYRIGRWQHDCDRKTFPPRGESGIDDLLFQILKLAPKFNGAVVGIKTIRADLELRGVAPNGKPK